MDDSEIVQLYWERSESAIAETSRKYGNYCSKIAINILENDEDAKECVNDTYFKTWNSIPQNRPSLLSTYLGKITRNLAINKYKQRSRKKRGTKVTVVLDELTECIPSADGIEKEFEVKYVANSINCFLRTLSEEDCNIFLRRYWYMDSIKDIAKCYAMSESKVKTKLFRTRKKMKNYLEGDEISI